MAKARQSELIANTDFPLYAVRMLGERHFVIAGGGGQAKTGIPNSMVSQYSWKIFEVCGIPAKTRQLYPRPTQRSAGGYGKPAA